MSFTDIVPILTSTVIECQRAGLKKYAFEYAATLMRSEYREQIDPKYSKKIEAVVRKAPKGIKDFDDETEQEVSPCPSCDAKLQDMEVNCYQCKTTIPICIATGQHIVKKGMTMCPECDFPAIKDEMIKVLEATNECPMCGEHVDSNRLIDLDDVTEYLGK